MIIVVSSNLNNSMAFKASALFKTETFLRQRSCPCVPSLSQGFRKLLSSRLILPIGSEALSSPQSSPPTHFSPFTTSTSNTLYPKAPVVSPTHPIHIPCSYGSPPLLHTSPNRATAGAAEHSQPGHLAGTEAHVELLRNTCKTRASMHTNVLHTHRDNKSTDAKPFLSASQKWNRSGRAVRKETDF